MPGPKGMCRDQNIARPKPLRGVDERGRRNGPVRGPDGDRTRRRGFGFASLRSRDDGDGATFFLDFTSAELHTANVPERRNAGGDRFVGVGIV